MAIIFRVPEDYPWWYNAWIALTGGTAISTAAWLTAFIYTVYEELDIMVLSRIVRQRDREAAEARQQTLDAQERELAERSQELAEREQELERRQEFTRREQELAEQRQELAEREQDVVERERVLRNLAEHLPPQYRAEFERLTRNGKETGKEQ